MAEIRGFRGIRYDSSSKDVTSKLAPPYDVVDAKRRESLATLDPKNCVELICPLGSADTKYKQVRKTMDSWLKEGTLKRDAELCIYRVHQFYTHEACGPNPVTRKGFIAAVKLHDFDENVVRRHELTLKGPKIDRFNLWSETDCHLSQIFALYNDSEKSIDKILNDHEQGEPDFEGKTDDGTLHQCWAISDDSVIRKVSGFLKDKPLYIADGHHRYETMLALRDKKRQNTATSSSDSHEFGMMFLCNVSDPGLVVLPTHRLIHDVSEVNRETFKEKLAAVFDVEEVQRKDSDNENLRALIKKAGGNGPSFGCVFANTNEALVLTLKEGLDLKSLGLGDEKVLHALDVHVLHTLVLEQLLGITKKAQEAKTNIHYIRKFDEAISRMENGEGQMCFLMNDSPVQQMVDVSDAQKVMPQKSTFFYPKVASGTVFYPLS